MKGAYCCFAILAEESSVFIVFVFGVLSAAGAGINNTANYCIVTLNTLAYMTYILYLLCYFVQACKGKYSLPNAESWSCTKLFFMISHFHTNASPVHASMCSSMHTKWQLTHSA